MSFDFTLQWPVTNIIPSSDSDTYTTIYVNALVYLRTEDNTFLYGEEEREDFPESLFLKHKLSLSHAHTHVHTHTHAHARTQHTHTHRHTDARAQTLAVKVFSLQGDLTFEKRASSQETLPFRWCQFHQLVYWQLLNAKILCCSTSTYFTNNYEKLESNSVMEKVKMYAQLLHFVLCHAPKN